MKPLKILVACEESQAVCAAFRRIGRRKPDCVAISDVGGGYILAFHGPGYDAYIAPMIVE